MSKYYAVLIRELDGTLLGRLAPGEQTTKRKLFAAMFTLGQAEEVAGNINAAGFETATVIPF